MTHPISFGSIDGRLVAGEGSGDARELASRPFRILVLGDFGARAHRGVRAPLKGRRPLRIDRDDFDEVMAKLRISLALDLAEGAGSPVAVGVSALEDLHPDRLVETVEAFARLRETRRRLASPRTFEAAAKDVRRWTGTEEAPAPSPPTDAVPTDGAGVLDSILGNAPARAGAEDPFERLLRSIARPHAIAVDPRADELAARVDELMSDLMRRVLRAPAFRTAESNWRALKRLTQSLDTGTMLSIDVLDVTGDELHDDLTASDDLAESALYALLAGPAQDVGDTDRRWALVATTQSFGPSATDAELLGRIALVAGAAGVPVIAGAAPALAGSPSIAELGDPREWKVAPSGTDARAWAALRALPEAAFIGLALPRVLMRLPYGAQSDPIESFRFEETGDDPAHEDYLWGSAAIACAELLGSTFERNGWDFDAGLMIDLEGLPLHSYRSAGEIVNKPCAEIALSERAATALMERGLSPLASIRDEDRVRLVRLQSIANPQARLRGAWEA